MNALFVMYDAHCGLCSEVRDWLQSQPTHLPLKVLASDSDEAQRKFPGLPRGELAVVSDQGDVWLGDHAFIVCLWALCTYRDWALRLASPLLRPVARQAFEAISRNRRNVSMLFGMKSDVELEKQLSEVTIPPCPTQ